MFCPVDPATKESQREGSIVKTCVLASGSSGNCTLVATDRTRILVDAGLSGKETFKRLSAIGENAEDIDAILVTHEHSDHVSGLAVLAKKLAIPVYLTHGTASAIEWKDSPAIVEPFPAGTRLAIGDIEIDSFTVPHDASDPVGYCFRAEGIKIGLVTDLGYVPDSIRFHLQGTCLLVLESNHDIEMLKVGPYPWSVKQRVMGRKGHLSNEVASEFIHDGMDSSTQTLVLGHLSEYNNHPELARATALDALDRRGLQTRLVVVEHWGQSEVFQF